MKQPNSISVPHTMLGWPTSGPECFLITKQSTSGSVSHPMLDWSTSGPELFSDHETINFRFSATSDYRLTNFLSRPASWLRTTSFRFMAAQNLTSGLKTSEEADWLSFLIPCGNHVLFINLWCDTIKNLNNVWICTRTLKAVSKKHLSKACFNEHLENTILEQNCPSLKVFRKM